MINKNTLKITSLGFLIATSLLTLTQCTKEGNNAASLDRSLKATDSTVFAQFYDSTIIATADASPDVNDIIRTTGIRSIIENRCAAASCHGAAIAPRLTTYGEITSLVIPGNPEASKLFRLVTTNNFHEAMPPVYVESLTVTEKVLIYNWIKNGAKERPALEDFRPAAAHIIHTGCASVNCHNSATIGGEWARKGLIGSGAADTINQKYTNLSNNSVTTYAILKEPKLSQVWGAYKDSARKYYSDTLANAAFRTFKTFAAPWTSASRRGPLSSYDDIVFDIIYPKNIRSNTGVIYTSPSGARYYSKSDHLNTADCFIRRIDSTLIFSNPRTLADASVNGSMAYEDGNLSPSEIALIKAWYFADPNIPDVWKYGINGQGIFKFRKSQNKITKK